MLLLYQIEEIIAWLSEKFTFHYASTLSMVWKHTYSAPAEFTFHYASTLSNDSNYSYDVSSNLHSTMLLLYRHGDSRLKPVFLEFTFHYASTLSQSFPSAVLFFDIIYIPLCFYFIFISPKRRHVVTYIYIPLCFYFIVDCRCPLPGDPHLHSTMLLLYLLAQIAESEDKTHLHSTMLLLYRNMGLQRPSGVPHLHSTMLLLYPRGQLLTETFKRNLHSTMLLLYRESGSRRRMTGQIIYIPLCFYFIENWRSIINDATEFTFHYASTLSICREMPGGSRTDLHSTMLLLYPDTVRGTRKDGTIFTFHYASTLSPLTILSLPYSIIYIPLCFYFIIPSVLGSSLVILIYIPLCFYFIFFRILICRFRLLHLHSTMLLLYR